MLIQPSLSSRAALRSMQSAWIALVLRLAYLEHLVINLTRLEIRRVPHNNVKPPVRHHAVELYEPVERLVTGAPSVVGLAASSGSTPYSVARWRSSSSDRLRKRARRVLLMVGRYLAAQLGLLTRENWSKARAATSASSSIRRRVASSSGNSCLACPAGVTVIALGARRLAT